VTSIPFENVDVRLGRPIGLDLESLQAKLVRRRRGGYCFEHNTLFSTALRALGFDVTTLEARVRPREATATLPRTHMTLLVRVEGRDVLADVGFGGTGPLLPVPLDGSVSEQNGGRYRIVPEDGNALVLQFLWRGVWSDLYAFTLKPALPVDYEVANHYTSTHPNSGFVKMLTVQRSMPERRQYVRGRSYMIRSGDEETMREITSEELPALLRDQFGLDVTDDEARQALGED
jgi:N-hydroxyarylamine O-acetyltransferase